MSDNASGPLYDLNKSFLENFHEIPATQVFDKHRVWPDQQKWHEFLGFRIASPIGVAACAITVGKKIKLLAQSGYDVLTYKTIRSQPYDGHSLPHILYVDAEHPLSEKDIEHPLSMKKLPCTDLSKIAISNSIGIACPAPDILAEDIALAKSSLHEGQILIVSVYGETNEKRNIVKDFAYTASLAKDSGADIIELNLSCPNLQTGHGVIYMDEDLTKAIITAVKQAIKNTPILIKLGLFSDQAKLRSLLLNAAKTGVSGISAINSVSMQVIHPETQQPAFDNRIYSGVSGYPIRQLALNFIRQLVDINQSDKLMLKLLGSGGITLPEHFTHFHNMGADIALSATSAMWNPNLGMQYQKLQA